MTSGHPFRDRVSADYNLITVMGYMDPAVEGATVIFGCPPQYVLVGPNSTTCMGNGEWEPDPGEVECICKGTYCTDINGCLCKGEFD